MKGFPKTVSILALPLFIEGNRRVSENRQGVHSLSVEREPIRDRFPGSIPRRGEGVLVNKAFTWQQTPPFTSQPPLSSPA